MSELAFKNDYENSRNDKNWKAEVVISLVSNIVMLFKNGVLIKCDCF